MARTYRVAIIGCGSIARAHACAYAAMPQCAIVAAADISQEALDRFGEQHGVSRLYTSYEEMLRLFEDHTRLAAILPLGLGDGEVRVAIGSEHHLEPLRDCSLVVGRYGQDSDVVGFVGVVGPTRMDYARSIGAVRYVGSLMGDLVRVMEGQ